MSPNYYLSLLMISSEDVLQQLNECSEHYTFPMLDNGYIYPAGAKMTVYRDETRWVIVIEAIGFSYRGGGHNGITNCLHVFGNCLTYQPGTDNNNFLYVTSESPDGDTFDDEEYFKLNPSSKTFLLRGRVTPLEHDRH